MQESRAGLDTVGEGVPISDGSREVYGTESVNMVYKNLIF